MDKRTYYAVKAKTEIYSDFMYYISFVNGIEKFTQNRYLYLITANDEEQEVEWEGAIKSIKRKFEKISSKLTIENKAIHKKVKQVLDASSAQSQEFKYLDKQQNHAILKLEKKIDKIETLVDSKIDKVETQIDRIETLL